MYFFIKAYYVSEKLKLNWLIIKNVIFCLKRFTYFEKELHYDKNTWFISFGERYWKT